VHEPEYVEAVSRFFQTIRRADEILEGLEYFLSRRAEMGMAVRGYPPGQFASWLSKPISGKGRIRVLYRYDEASVVMLDAWEIPASLEGTFHGRD
jgi:hypothetical protein